MSELRWDPLLKTWIMVAANRQVRPDMPKDWCPFCPGSGKVPDDYDVYCYNNDFPALSQNPDMPEDQGSGLYKASESYGKCEVILYSPEHNKTLADLSVEHIYKLVNMWTERFKELSKDKKIKYIFEFENKGKEVGVTMPHPHGQIYGYPFVPLRVKTELDNCREYYNENNSCLICNMNKEEKSFRQRVIAENAGFIAYIPYFTDYPYGVFIVSKNHKGSLPEFTEEEKKDLAAILKYIVRGFDNLFNKVFPYMMCIHQTPVNSQEYSDSGKYYHFHIEFYPPLRGENKIKYYASSEMGAWAACNPLSVEETAVKLKAACEK